MGFDFESVEYWGIVTGRNHDATGEFAAAHFKRDVRRWIGTVHHHDAKTITRKYFGRRMCKLLGLETHIEADENRSFGPFDRFEVLCRGLGGIAKVFESECIGNDASPSIRPEFNWNVHNVEKSVTTVLSPSTTPGRRIAERPI